MKRFFFWVFLSLLTAKLPDFRVFDDEWQVLTERDLPADYVLFYVYSAEEQLDVPFSKTLNYLIKVHNNGPKLIGFVEGYTFGALTHLKEWHHPPFPFYFLDVDQNFVNSLFPNGKVHTNFILLNAQREVVYQTTDLALIFLLMSEWKNISEKQKFISLLSDFQKNWQDNYIPQAFQASDSIGKHSATLRNYLRYQLFYRTRKWGKAAFSLQQLPSEVIALKLNDFLSRWEENFFHPPISLSEEEVSQLRGLLDRLNRLWPNNFLMSVSSGMLYLLEGKPREALRLFASHHRTLRLTERFYLFSQALSGDEQQFENVIPDIVKYLLIPAQRDREVFTQRLENRYLQPVSALEQFYHKHSYPIPATFDFFLHCIHQALGNPQIAMRYAAQCQQKSPKCKKWMEKLTEELTRASQNR